MTRIINADGRAALVLDGGIADIATASEGRFGPEPQSLYDEWEAFIAWAHDVSPAITGPYPQDPDVGSPSPTPRQVVGVGINYRGTVDAGGFADPARPGVFSKFVTSVSGPHEPLTITSDDVITEVEVAIVIGRRAEKVDAAEALTYAAGAATAQDINDKEALVVLQRTDGSPGPAYMDIGKSLPGFVPLGPELVTLDEVDDARDREIGLQVRGEVWQKDSSAGLVLGIPEIISYVSHRIPLLPGDVILTGSPNWLPEGLGEPLRDGDHIVASVAGLGEQRQTVVRAERTAR